MASTLMAARRAVPRLFAVASQQARGMATEKQIYNQIQSTKNIMKITSSMKMVSAAKLKGDENRLAVAEPFNEWSYALCPEPQLTEDATFEELPQKCLIVPLTSEKGLCGGINSFISRNTKILVQKLKDQGKECDIVVIGDKGRMQMRRTLADNITRSVTEVQTPGTFTLASAIASEVVAAGAMENYDSVVIVYNSYVNAAVYNQMYKVLPPFVFEGSEEAVTLANFEFDSDFNQAEVLKDLYEYMLASQLFHSFMDGAAAEQSARMTAMENATKNAGELVDALTLQYNRARQARITTELIEIISGASALDD